MDHPSKVFGRVADSEASDDLPSVKKKQRRDHPRSHVMKTHPDKRGDATPTGEESGYNFNHQDEGDNHTGEGASGGQEEAPRKLECVVCGQDTFPDLGALRRHYKGHKRKYICRFCGVQLSSAANLMRHNLLHTGVKPFECQKCHRRFSRKDVLKAHLGAHENDNVKRALSRRFGCNKCPARYTSRYNLMRHVRQCHQQNKILKRRRGQGQRRIPQQAEHQSAEETGNRYPIDPSNPLKCTHCQKLFPTTNSLSKHLWYHNQERRFTCQVCQRGFKYAMGLRRHVVMHSAGRNLSLMQKQPQGQGPLHSTPVNAQRKYPCDYCTRIFNHASNRSRHVRRFHSDKLGQGQSQTGTGQQRQEPRSVVQQLTVKDRVRRAGISMAFHRRRVQPVPRIQQKGNRASDLMTAQQMQIRANDAAEEVQANYNGMHKCELCGKEFDKRLAYKMHLRTHNKQFVCGVCGLKTATRGDLTMHIRTHTGERPFQCSYPNCPWKFARRSQLTAHFRRHHGPEAKVKRQYNHMRVTRNLVQGSVPGTSSSPHEGQLSRNSSSILLGNLPFNSVSHDDVEMMDTEEQKIGSPADTKKILPARPPLIRYPLSAVPMVTMTRPNAPGPPPTLVRRPVLKVISKNTTVEQQQQLTVVSCQRCGELFGSRQDLTVHTLVAHSTVGTPDREDIEWDMNGEDINIVGDAADLLFPEVVITEEVLSIITVVSASSTPTTALADHKEPIYPCTVTGCGRRFNLKYDLIRHMRRHLQESPPPHACPEPGCESSFYQESDLNRHLQKMHNNRKESPFHPCQHCAARFTKPDLLVNHMKSNHPGQDISHVLLLQIWLEQKREDEERQMQEFLANLPPEDEEEEVAVFEANQVQPGFGQEHDMDYSFTLQQLEIDAFDNDDELVSRESQSPPKRSKKWVQEKTTETQSPKLPPQSQAPSTSSSIEMMEKLPNENGALETGEPFTCETCNKVFYNRQKFVSHRHYHLREYRYTCPEPGCEEKFKMKGHVERHIRTYHNSERPVQHVLHCPVPDCNRKFVRNCDFTNHVEKMHPTQNVTAEPHEEMVQNILELNEDCNAEEIEPEVPLDDENDQQSKGSSLLQPCSNRLEEYTNEQGELFCAPCKKHFKDLKALQNHVYYHIRVPKHRCEVCGAKFKHRNELLRHMNVHHNPENPRECIPCPKCKRSFTSHRYLKIHLKRECGGGAKEEENPEKGKTFSSDKEQLPVHQCQYCPKYFHIKKSLDTHRRRHHSHLRNLIACQICRAKFQAVEHLESHMKSHQLT